MQTTILCSMAKSPDARLAYLAQDLLNAAKRYKEIRIKQENFIMSDSPEEFYDLSNSRSMAHNTLCTCVNTLVGYCEKNKLSLQWLKEIGNTERETIGQWAISISFTPDD